MHTLTQTKDIIAQKEKIDKLSVEVDVGVAKTEESIARGARGLKRKFNL